MIALDIAQAAIDSIVGHARREAPHECCGLLVGKRRAIERAVAARNESESPLTRYRVNPADHFAVIRELRGTDRQIVGAYHSHVSTDAAPSPLDIREGWGAPFVYVIVSLKDNARPDVRAYQLKEGTVLPVTLFVSGP